MPNISSVLVIIRPCRIIDVFLNDMIFFKRFSEVFNFSVFGDRT